MRGSASQPTKAFGFSLVEVVLAIGVITFAIIAILGMFPIALQTSHSAQDETRTRQIAKDVLDSIASQAQAKYPNVTINQPATTFSYKIDLSNSYQYNTMAADNDGRLIALTNSSDAVQYPYQVLVQVNPAPAGFDPGYASQVVVRIISPPSPNPSATPLRNQTIRDYVRIISKY